MAMWHCPNCGTPQAETARCWVCHRSSTTCSTCRHFRRALAGDLGYCGLDARRVPLTGLEVRGCWAERRPTDMAPKGVPAYRPPLRIVAAARVGTERVAATPPETPARDFVPVELHVVSPTASRPPARRRAKAAPAAEGVEVAMPIMAAEPDEGWANRTSLFGDAEV